MNTGNQNQNSSLFDLHINQESKYHLLETAKWTKFLAIVGFILIILMITYGIFMSFIIEDRITGMEQDLGQNFPVGMYRSIILVYTVVFGIIYFFPCLFTLRFSNHMRTAFQLNDQTKLTLAFRNLKATARYLGILTIVALVFLLVAVIFLIVFFINMPDISTVNG